ncbi:hypothetical protein Tco_1396290 [Tanacetum coccineum]
MKEISDTLNNLIPKLIVAKTNELLKKEVPRMINDAIKKDREIATSNVPEMISREFVTHAPRIIEELFKSYAEHCSQSIHVVPFPEDDLEEKMNRWVQKEFKTFNKKEQLSIQHWKDSWHKRMYKLNQRKVKDNPKEYFSNHRIVEVVRVTTEQQHGLDYMEQIIVMRETDQPDSFSEADFKYLNKNDIEDMYYLFLNKKVNFRENKLLNSLMTTCKVHDAHHGNDGPPEGEKRAQRQKIPKGYELIVKFCDAMLERVLNEVKLNIFETKFLKKAPLLGGLDLDIIKAYEREITKRLRHREQM